MKRAKQPRVMRVEGLTFMLMPATSQKWWAKQRVAAHCYTQDLRVYRVGRNK